MHLIIGGKYMGKLAYAKTLYGADISVCDLCLVEAPLAETGLVDMENMFEARVTVNLQEGVRSMLKREQSVRDFFERNLDRLKEKILIGDEIGSGIVPLDGFERLWRDETGLLYQALAARADIVDRVWAGIPLRLKG